MKHKLIGILFLVGLFVASCIDPYPFDPPLPEASLVVDGFITDRAGPIEVRLSTAAAYGSVVDTNNYNKPVTDAIVRLTDDTGSSVLLTHSNSFPGRYLTSDMQGEVGKSYELKINWDGKTFLSRPERIPPPVPLDTVYADLVANDVVNQRGVEAEVCQYEIRVNVNDPAGEANHYFWRYRYIYQQVTTSTISTGTQCFVRGWGKTQFGLTNDAFVDGNPILDFPIGKILYDFWQPKFLIDVDQYLLTAEAYAYWAQIKQQQFNVGSVFDPPPSSLRGNVYCQEDSNQLAYGYFAAASVTTNYTKFRRPSNDCFTDLQPEGSCSLILNSSQIDPPDPRWW